MLQSRSYYFDGGWSANLVKDTITTSWELNVRSDFKNYDNEIEHFLDWLAPHIYTDGFLGYYRYEEEDMPTLIFMSNGVITHSAPLRTAMEEAK